MAVYYIDSLCGDDENDGLTELTAKASYRGLSLCDGDTVLLRTGTEYRDTLTSKANGVRITSYGDGDMPKITLSTQRSAPYLWGADGENVYKLLIKTAKEPKNVIFDFGAYAGERTSRMPRVIGQWQATKTDGGYELRLYSDGSPTTYYRDIEVAADVTPALTVCGDCEINGISFFGTAGPAVSITAGKAVIRDCRFEFAGTPGEDTNCLNIAGSAEISDCSFMNTYAPSIRIYGGASDVSIVSNTFTSFRRCGVLTDGKDCKTMIELNVFDPTSADKFIASAGAVAPVEVISGHDVTIRRNVFRKLHEPIVSDGASSTVENNEKQ